MHYRSHRLAAVLAGLTLGLPLLALAQGRPDPADPKVPTPALGHRSAFADYKAFQDLAPGDWRRLNDTVGSAGLKQGAAPAAPAPVPAPAASAPGHKMPMAPMPGHHQHMQGGRR